jgi:hypothetical protein
MGISPSNRIQWPKKLSLKARMFPLDDCAMFVVGSKVTVCPEAHVCNLLHCVHHWDAMECVICCIVYIIKMVGSERVCRSERVCILQTFFTSQWMLQGTTICCRGQYSKEWHTPRNELVHYKSCKYCLIDSAAVQPEIIIDHSKHVCK